MPIKVTCPKCQGVLHAPDDAGGKRGKCPTCGTVLSIPAEAPRVGGPGPGPDIGYRAPAAPDEIRQSSFGSRPPEPEIRKAPAPTRIPPPPAEPRKLSDPFAKPGSAIATDASTKAWRRTRRGLGTVQLALFCFLLAVIAVPVLRLAQHFGITLPEQNPGYLGQLDLTSAQEIRIASVVIPLVLGILFLTLGRLGVTNAPRSSYARGPALLAGVASLFVFIGTLAVAVPSIGQVMAEGMPVVQQQGRIDFVLLPDNDINGIAQRVGLGLWALFIPIAEVWFISALGRMGSGLHSGRASGRHTRFVMVVGFLLGLFALYGAALLIDPELLKWGRGWAVQQYSNAMAHLGDNRILVDYGIPIVVALIGWLMYCRLVSGVRRAIREWLDEYATA